jgi:hypothetical protein
MKARPPSTVALAFFDCFVADNEPLKGDLIEEFEARQSQWWLWRQVIGAVVSQPQLRGCDRERTELLVLGAAVLVLASFEAVFVTNVLHHLVFGPPLPNITGWAYLLPGREVDTAAGEVMRTALSSMYAPVVAMAASAPTAWFISRFHQRHYAVSRGAFALSVMACTSLGLQLPFGVQFLTTFAFVLGLLMSGCVVVATLPGPVDRVKQECAL